VGIDAAEVSGLVQVSLRVTVVFVGYAFPPVELAGYFQWASGTGASLGTDLQERFHLSAPPVLCVN